MKSQSQEQHEKILNGLDIPVLESLVIEGCNNIPSGIKQAVLVIGDTGSGKSSLINALTGRSLNAVSVKKGLKKSLILEGSEDGPVIGSTSVSETTVPKVWYSQNGVAYFDCPGFEDTKGAEQDIANGVFVNKLFKSIEEVKIVLVVSQNQLESDRAKDVIKLVKKVTSMFPSQNQIKVSTSLILSKAEADIKAQDVREGMLDIISEHEKDNSSTTFYSKVNSKLDKAKHLVGMEITKELNEVGQMWNLITHSNICVFHAPRSEGQYVIDQSVISSINDKTSYAKKPDVNIAISDHSRVLIRTTYDYLVKSAESKIKALGKEIDKFKLKETDTGSVNEGLISKLIKIKNILSNINSQRIKHEVDKHNIAEFSNKISELHGVLGIKQDSISPTVEMFSLLKRVVNDGINQDVSDCLKGFNELDARIIKEVTQYTTSIKNTITAHIEGLIKSSYDSMLGLDKSVKQELKGQIQSLNKFQNFEYIEKAANIVYSTVKNDENKGCYDAIVSSINLVRDINKVLVQEQIIISAAEMQAGIALIMNGMLLSEKELEERKIKIEKTKALVETSYYQSKTNGSEEANSIKITGNKFIVDGEYANKIMNFHKEIKSETIYLNYGKYTFMLGISSIQLDSSVKIDSGNLFMCAPLIKFSPGVEIDLSGQDGVDFSNQKAANGTWSSSAAVGNITAIYTLIPIVNLVAASLYEKWSAYQDPANTKAGSSGNPGKDGEPGFPGGNLIMLSYNYQGLEGLKVNTSGGKGGSGQDGGDGGSCNENYLTAPEARAGGDGGNGGNSGRGGPKGFIKVMKINKDKKTEDKSKDVFLKAVDGTDGQPGKGGAGGIGWKPGAIKEKFSHVGKDGEKGDDGRVSYECKEFTFIDFINEHTVREAYRSFVSESPCLGPEVETLGELGYESFI